MNSRIWNILLSLIGYLRFIEAHATGDFLVFFLTTNIGDDFDPRGLTKPSCSNQNIGALVIFEKTKQFCFRCPLEIKKKQN